MRLPDEFVLLFGSLQQYNSINRVVLLLHQDEIQKVKDGRNHNGVSQSISFEVNWQPCTWSTESLLDFGILNALTFSLAFNVKFRNNLLFRHKATC